jgi:saccharopine dehydrogenase-like NADP-dependent oxidoreductase
MRVLVVGAGRVGPVIASTLNHSGDFHAELADITEEAEERADRAGLSFRRFDAARPNEAERHVGEFDAVVAAVPQWASERLAPVAIAKGVAYLDLAEDSHALASAAARAKSAVVPGCGFSPGLQHDIAANAIEGLEGPISMVIRVGALPATPSNRLGYGLSWNVEGLIGEYTRKGPALVDGGLAKVDPMEGCEALEMNGTRLEAFTTSGGSEALCRRLAGKVANLTFKTLRYPGHAELVRFLLDDLGLKTRKDHLATLFRNGLPEVREDVLLSLISVEGFRNGVPIEMRFMQRVESMALEDGSFVSALSRASAAHVCAMLDLIREGRPEFQGLVYHEDLPFELVAENRFVRQFARGDT